MYPAPPSKIANKRAKGVFNASKERFLRKRFELEVFRQKFRLIT